MNGVAAPMQAGGVAPDQILQVGRLITWRTALIRNPRHPRLGSTFLPQAFDNPDPGQG